MKNFKFILLILLTALLTTSIQAENKNKSFPTARNIAFRAEINSVQKILTLTACIEGLYNDITDTMVADSVQVYIREDKSPYQFLDSAKGFLNASGVGIFLFDHMTNNYDFRIIVKHRNSIETWSNEVIFVDDTLSYNFTESSSKAVGNNLILKGTKYCIYSGDADQDGAVGISDESLIENDILNFVTGYVRTDLTGDNLVDLSDIAIADNNSFNFVSVQRPPYVNNSFPTITIENGTIDGVPASFIACENLVSVPIGRVIEFDMVSTDPDFEDILEDTVYFSPDAVGATLIYTPALPNEGKSPLITHVYLMYPTAYSGYTRFETYDLVHHEARCFLNFTFY